MTKAKAKKPAASQKKKAAKPNVKKASRPVAKPAVAKKGKKKGAAAKPSNKSPAKKAATPKSPAPKNPADKNSAHKSPAKKNKPAAPKTAPSHRLADTAAAPHFAPHQLSSKYAGPVKRNPPRPIPPPTIVPPKPIAAEPPPAFSYDRQAALKALAAVIHLFDKRDWRAAFKAAQSLPRLFPDFIEGVNKAVLISAICRRQLGRPESPKSPEDFELLATEHLNQGDGEGALKLLATGLHKHGKHGGLHYLRACALVQVNHSAEAIAALARAIELDPQNRIYALNGKDFAPLRLNPDFLALIKH